MNILYISALEGGKYTGPLYSVPKRIMGQSKYDNVYWINMTEIPNANIFDDDFYHYIPFKKFKLSLLPIPFNKPDLIVFEEFFKLECCLVARKVERLKIPYIIVPRCQMTTDYLKNKKFKKLIASFALFNHFTNHSLAVQFLTEQEKKDSNIFYNDRSFIAPNGIVVQEEQATVDNSPIVGTFIGRYSIWQKGLDLLFSAIEKERDLLEKLNVRFDLYGPDDRTGSATEVRVMVIEKGIEKFVNVNGPVFDDEKKRVLLKSNFFVHTSRFEGMPMSVLDALSYGVPCLVTQGSNLRENIEKYKAGWGADTEVGSIAYAIEEMCQSIGQFGIFGENAKRLAKTYSWDVISEKCHNIYTNLLENY